jgi:hypothetical protein
LDRIAELFPFVFSTKRLCQAPTPPTEVVHRAVHTCGKLSGQPPDLVVVVGSETCHEIMAGKVRTLPLCQGGEYWQARKRRQDRENRRCVRLRSTVSTAEVPGGRGIFQQLANAYWPTKPTAKRFCFLSRPVPFLRDLTVNLSHRPEVGGSTATQEPSGGSTATRVYSLRLL